MENSKQYIESIRRRAEEIFERDIEPLISGEDPRRFIAIDVETGNFELDPKELAAMNRLRARNPAATIWIRRVGSPEIYRFLSHQKARA